MLPEGSTLQPDHRYEIHRVLSEGGMGVIYQATDLNMRAPVVIKESRFNDKQFLRQLFPGLAEAQLRRQVDLWRAAFDREARLLFGLRHNALPRSLNYFELEYGNQFLVMELIPGKDLSDLLEERYKAGHGPFPVAQVLDWADQLLDVLSYLHMEFPEPIIHRDIKPQNLKRTPKGQIILLDFGLAKGSTPEMSTVGNRSMPGHTLSYAAPEQIGGEGTDARSDIYSLGVTLYQLMTGEIPPNAVVRTNALARSRKGNPDPIEPAHEINSGIAEEISQVIHRAIELLPDHRFDSVNQMRAALRYAATRSGDRADRSIITRPGYEETTLPTYDESTTVAPSSFTEDLGDGIKLEMTRIEAGSFSMGTLDGISLDGEHPRHFVTLSSFYSSICPITQAQWQALMRTNPSNFKGDQLPVENVSWQDAMRFCQTLAARSGKPYRLLTEAEWEYACRAGTTGDFSFGNDESQLSQHAWYVENSDQQTHAVGQRKPNAMGLYDMHGNVWEWCGDWHDELYYVQSPDFDPQGPDSGTTRVLRGGSWEDDAYSCRSARRNSGDPFNRSMTVGFRVAV
jgi:formylglycine-generating enzyme required for sulfatase activity